MFNNEFKLTPSLVVLGLISLPLTFPLTCIISTVTIAWSVIGCFIIVPILPIMMLYTYFTSFHHSIFSLGYIVMEISGWKKTAIKIKVSSVFKNLFTWILGMNDKGLFSTLEELYILVIWYTVNIVGVILIGSIIVGVFYLIFKFFKKNRKNVDNLFEII
jgi:hypothetical protein